MLKTCYCIYIVSESLAFANYIELETAVQAAKEYSGYILVDLWLFPYTGDSPMSTITHNVPHPQIYRL